MKKIVVAGAGGFIGGHLVKELIKKHGNSVRAVDLKPLNEWYQVSGDADNLVLDLRLRENCYKAVNGYNEVFNLAADMGGMGFIENNKAACDDQRSDKYTPSSCFKGLRYRQVFYASSACVYNGESRPIRIIRA